MMKFVLLASVIAVAVATTDVGNKMCTPGSTFNIDCNKCRCANDGSGAVCTRKYCLPDGNNADSVHIAPAHDISKRSVADDLMVVDEGPEYSESGNEYKLVCNRCARSKEGQFSCTRIKCVHALEKRSIRIDYPELPHGNCEFGKTYKKGCNTCFCGKAGVTTCTLMNCNADVVYYNRNRRDVENWGPRYQEGDECEPRKIFYNECNKCICGNNGRSAVCTLKMCLPRHQE